MPYLICTMLQCRCFLGIPEAFHNADWSLLRSSERIIQKLCSDIKQMQNLVCSQGNKIASCKEEIEGYITKLQTLDQQVQLLNTKITQIRQDSRDRMLQTLQQTSQRKPQMQKAHTRHERLVTSIENYRKGANYLIRLSNLDKRVKAARQRQDIWDALQSWIPTVGKLKNACSNKPKEGRSFSFWLAILILTVLISLLVSLCRSYWKKKSLTIPTCTYLLCIYTLFTQLRPNSISNQRCLWTHTFQYLYFNLLLALPSNEPDVSFLQILVITYVLATS